jgi:hypothetical protein
MDLGNAHLSHPEKLIGLWQRNGVDPGAPVHPLKAATNPVIIDDDDIVYKMRIVPMYITNDLIPCRIASYVVYVSGDPYSQFEVFARQGDDLIDMSCISSRKFYRATSCIGEWASEVQYE